MRTLRNTNKNGFALIEVIIASLIFLITIVGMLIASVNLKQRNIDSSQDVTAAFVAKGILDDLRIKLSPQEWAVDGELAEGVYPLAGILVDGVTYNATYTVVNDPNSNGRNVNIEVVWGNN